MLEPLTMDEVLEATGGRVAAGVDDAKVGPHSLPNRIIGVSTDSRSLRPGELYLPLQGKNFDGHQFVNDALAHGAAAALSTRQALQRVPSDPQRTILVDDTLSSYHRLAAYYRRKFTLGVVGITGSFGKTTTKDLMAALLSTHFPNVLKTSANLNNEFGVPQTILKIDSSTGAAVIEMAMRGREQIRPLARIAQPQVGIVTNVGEAHLELLGSLEAICDAKAELLDEMGTDSCAVLPRDSQWFDRLVGHARGRVISFGFDPRSDVRVVEAIPQGVAAQRVRIDVQGTMLTLHLPLPGPHNACNLAACIAGARILGIPMSRLEDFPQFLETSGRRNEMVLAAGGWHIMNDAYNAGPSSMKAALNTLAAFPVHGRRAAVLADMLELGPRAAEFHRDVGAHAAGIVDYLVTLGELGRTLSDAARAAGMPANAVMHVDDRATAARAIEAWARPGDVVLVKASRGMQLDEVVRTMTADPA